MSRAILDSVYGNIIVNHLVQQHIRERIFRQVVVRAYLQFEVIEFGLEQPCAPLFERKLPDERPRPAHSERNLRQLTLEAHQVQLIELLLHKLSCRYHRCLSLIF